MSAGEVPVPIGVRKALEAFAQGRDGRKGRVVAYPAGQLTRAMVQAGLFNLVELLAIADRQPGLQGLSIGATEVVAPQAIAALQPEAVLICSSQFHLSIQAELADSLKGTGIAVVDLCASFKAHMVRDLAGQAEHSGLVLLDPGDGVLCLREPGFPGRSMLARDAHWSSLEWAIPQFAHYFDNILPAIAPDGEAILDFSRPGYHTYRESGLRLFSPSVVQPEDLLRQYVELGKVGPGDTVLDLGAYNGDSAIFFSRAVGPEGTVLAVEADPYNFAALEKNVREHDLRNVRLTQAAVWSSDGTGSFLLDASVTSGLVEGFDFGLGDALGDGSRFSRVKTMTLETVLRDQGLDRVDVLKMDTEGAEMAILVASMPLLRRLHPRMIIEPHVADHPEGLGAMVKLLAENGFEVLWLEKDNLILAT